jgi:hypothetical protein
MLAGSAIVQVLVGVFYTIEREETASYFNKIYDTTVPGFRSEK